MNLVKNVAVQLTKVQCFSVWRSYFMFFPSITITMLTTLYGQSHLSIWTKPFMNIRENFKICSECRLLSDDRATLLAGYN
jgi:hypothetical protein